MFCEEKKTVYVNTVSETLNYVSVDCGILELRSGLI